MQIERGDSVVFGEKWCEEFGRKDLVNRAVKFTPQWFEVDNGLYCHEVECPGIYDEENQESDSIYHLFGNDFENFMDCKLIKGTQADKDAYQKIIQELLDAQAKAWDSFVV